MQLSKEAILDLRRTMKESYGDDFDKPFSDEDLNQIGDLLLTSYALALKRRMNNKKLGK